MRGRPNFSSRGAGPSALDASLLSPANHPALTNRSRTGHGPVAQRMRTGPPTPGRRTLGLYLTKTVPNGTRRESTTIRESTVRSPLGFSSRTGVLTPYRAPARLRSWSLCSRMVLVLPGSAKIDSPAYSPVVGGLAWKWPLSRTRKRAPDPEHGAG